MTQEIKATHSQEVELERLRNLADRCSSLAQSTPVAGEPDPLWWERQAALSAAADQINAIAAAMLAERTKASQSGGEA